MLHVRHVVDTFTIGLVDVMQGLLRPGAIRWRLPHKPLMLHMFMMSMRCCMPSLRVHYRHYIDVTPVACHIAATHANTDAYVWRATSVDAVLLHAADAPVRHTCLPPRYATPPSWFVDVDVDGPTSMSYAFYVGTSGMPHASRRAGRLPYAR
jgi:hypothetical protein